MTQHQSPLAPDRLLPLLRGSFGQPYLYAPVCRSTQDLLKEVALPEGAVAVTEHQTAGRGRVGRHWEDAAGAALLVSLLLRPPVDTVLPQLSLVVGLAAAEAIERAAGIATFVKWPNDVILDGRKIAGILLEVSGEAVVCGIGVNVNQTADQLSETARVPAGSLRTVTHAEHDRAALLADLLDTIERRYATWRAGGMDAIVFELAQRNALLGRRARSGDEHGVVGMIAGDGRLELVLDSGERRLVESGEIDVDL